ncbi:hypothetical protein [Nonomuraea terrae]|uniref:hypothetical protein n=1 Tax=Nonomuraea terrae TaxID=2530383 RepID=UPI003CCC6E9E
MTGNDHRVRAGWMEYALMHRSERTFAFDEFGPPGNLHRQRSWPGSHRQPVRLTTQDNERVAGQVRGKTARALLTPRFRSRGAQNAGQSHGDHGDVVLARHGWQGEQLVAEGLEGLAGQTSAAAAQSFRPYVEVLTGHFHQAVGVEQQRAAPRQDRDGAAARRGLVVSAAALLAR